jgi:hypothetical protein
VRAVYLWPGFSDDCFISQSRQSVGVKIVSPVMFHKKKLAEPTHTLPYNKLRNEWFKELGVVGHTAGHFYKYEFGEYEKIVKLPVDWVLPR